MVMTHYMELLSLDQPYNLILYMVIPMGLAELLVAMEFFTMYHMDSGKNAGFKAVSKFVGIVLGVYFTALVIYFLAKNLSNHKMARICRYHRYLLISHRRHPTSWHRTFRAKFDLQKRKRKGKAKASLLPAHIFLDRLVHCDRWLMHAQSEKKHA